MQSALKMFSRLLPCLALSVMAVGCGGGDSDKIIEVPAGTSNAFAPGQGSGGSSGGGGSPPGPVIPTLNAGILPPGELPGITVTLTGTNFAPGMIVNFGGMLPTPMNITGTSVQVNVPVFLAGNQNVFVNVNGQGSNVVTYTVGPTVTNTAPTSAAAGATINVNGTGFRPPTGMGTMITGNFVDYVVRLAAAPAEFIDISMTGLNLMSGDDTVTNLNTTFPGNSFWLPGAITVDSNPNVRAPGSNGASDFTPDPFPVTGNVGPRFIAAFWDDLSPNLAGGVFAAQQTVGGRPALIVSWDGVPEFGGMAPGYTTQIQLFGDAMNPGGKFVYLDVVNGQPNDNGAIATIGYQNNQTPVTGFDQFSTQAMNVPVAQGTVIDLVQPTMPPQFQVNFGGTLVTGMVVSSTSATVTVPMIGAGAVALSVANPDGRVSANSITFTVVP